MTKSQVTFVGLSVSAPAAFLLFYPVFRQSEPAAWALMICGVVFGLLLLGWSLWSFRRHPARAIVGLLICIYCFWQILVIPGYVKAAQSHLTVRWPNSVAGVGAGRTPEFMEMMQVGLSRWFASPGIPHTIPPD